METVLEKLVEQAPLGVLIIVFVILWTRDQYKQQAARDAARDKAQELRDTAVQTSMDKRDDLMRQFWAGQQTSNREVLERLAISVEKVANRLEEHDQKTDTAIGKMEERTAQRAGKPKAP